MFSPLSPLFLFVLIYPLRSPEKKASGFAQPAVARAVDGVYELAPLAKFY
jgi:hypothetical protein